MSRGGVVSPSGPSTSRCNSVASAGKAVAARTMRSRTWGSTSAALGKSARPLAGYGGNRARRTAMLRAAGPDGGGAPAGGGGIGGGPTRPRRGLWTAWPSTLLSCPIVPNWVRSSGGCVTDGCGRTSAKIATLEDAVAAFNPTERIRGQTVIRVRP